MSRETFLFFSFKLIGDFSASIERQQVGRVGISARSRETKTRVIPCFQDYCRWRTYLKSWAKLAKVPSSYEGRKTQPLNPDKMQNKTHGMEHDNLMSMFMFDYYCHSIPWKSDLEMEQFTGKLMCNFWYDWQQVASLLSDLARLCEHRCLIHLFMNSYLKSPVIVNVSINAEEL